MDFKTDISNHDPGPLEFTKPLLDSSIVDMNPAFHVETPSQNNSPSDFVQLPFTSVLEHSGSSSVFAFGGQAVGSAECTSELPFVSDGLDPAIDGLPSLSYLDSALLSPLLPTNVLSTECLEKHINSEFTLPLTLSEGNKTNLLVPNILPLLDCTSRPQLHSLESTTITKFQNIIQSKLPLQPDDYKGLQSDFYKNNTDIIVDTNTDVIVVGNSNDNDGNNNDNNNKNSNGNNNNNNNITNISGNNNSNNNSDNTGNNNNKSIIDSNISTIDSNINQESSYHREGATGSTFEDNHIGLLEKQNIPAADQTDHTTTTTKSYSQVASNFLSDTSYTGPQPHVTVTKECAVYMERLQNTNLDMYCRAIERQIGQNHIIFLGRAPGDPNKILVFLENPRFAERLVRVGINVRGRWLMVSFRSLPATRLILSGVLPYIEDDVLVAALAPFGTVATPIMRRIRAATKNPSFKKIFSFRRETYLYINKGSTLPDNINIDHQGEQHVIEISTDGIKCYRCGNFGHSITFCDRPQSSPEKIQIPDSKENSILDHHSYFVKHALPSVTPKEKALPPKPINISNSVIETQCPQESTKKIYINNPNAKTLNHSFKQDTTNSLFTRELKNVSDTYSIMNNAMEYSFDYVDKVNPQNTCQTDDYGWKKVIHSNKRKRRISHDNEEDEPLQQGRDKDSKKSEKLHQEFESHSIPNKLSPTQTVKSKTDERLSHDDSLYIHEDTSLQQTNTIGQITISNPWSDNVFPPGHRSEEDVIQKKKKTQVTAALSPAFTSKEKDDLYHHTDLKPPPPYETSVKKKGNSESDYPESQIEEIKKQTKKKDPYIQNQNPYIKVIHKVLTQSPKIDTNLKSDLNHSINPATASQITKTMLQEIRYKSDPAKASILKRYHIKYPRLIEYLKTALECDKQVYICGNHMHKKLTDVIGDLKRTINPPNWDMRVRTSKTVNSENTGKPGRKEGSKRKQNLDSTINENEDPVKTFVDNL